jgi:hypothetical protein
MKFTALVMESQPAECTREWTAKAIAELNLNRLMPQNYLLFNGIQGIHGFPRAISEGTASNRP